MPLFCISGLEINFPFFIPKLAVFESRNVQQEKDVSSLLLQELALSRHTIGWVGGAQRQVETWSSPSGVMLKVSGGCDVFISPGGQDLIPLEAGKPKTVLEGPDLEILLGPALVLALALRGTWCLHASAATFRGRLIAFLGESGQGKSTLAAYLATAGRPQWQLAADDILPVVPTAKRVDARLHFPQLKLSVEAQPGPQLPESLPLERICILTQTDPDSQPGLQLTSPNEAIRLLIHHTAGTRLFDPALLSKHLAFCTRAAGQIPVYQLTYPHRRDTLPAIMEFLETLC